MTVSFPASAPETPPLTGASRKPIPFSARRAAVWRDVAGSPEVQSMRSEPFAMVARRPSAPSSRAATSREGGRQVITISAPRAASAGVFAWRTLLAAAKAAALEAVRFQTESVNPGGVRCFAIGAPMAPRPRNAMEGMRGKVIAHRSNRYPSHLVSPLAPALKGMATDSWHEGGRPPTSTGHHPNTNCPSPVLSFNELEHPEFRKVAFSTRPDCQSLVSDGPGL